MKRTVFFLLFLLNVGLVYSQIGSSVKPAIEGWYFRAVTGYPVSISFEPIVLLEDGTYFEVEEEPVEEMDYAEFKRNRPKLWGTWTKEYDKHVLTNHKNNTYKYDLSKGNWFKAFPYNNSISLKGKYKKVSGGNFGNGIYSYFKSEIVFLDNTHFTSEDQNVVGAYGSTGWNNSKYSGSYKIDQNTIEFKYNDGKTVRLSFAIGAKGDNVLSTDMIFIGGKAYVIE